MPANRRTVRLLLAAVVLVLAACKLPYGSGDYRARPLLSVTPEIAVEVRNLGLVTASRLLPGNNGRLTYFDRDEMRTIRPELQAAIARDLHTGGPFRPPRYGEPAYQLDVWIDNLSMPLRGGYIPVAMIGWLMLGVPFVLGVPMGVFGEDGQAVFHLYTPDGTLVLEDSFSTRKSYAAGLYYGERPIGHVAAPLVQELKRKVIARRRQILAGVPVTMQHPPDSIMLGARAHQTPYGDDPDRVYPEFPVEGAVADPILPE